MNDDLALMNRPAAAAVPPPRAATRPRAPRPEVALKAAAEAAEEVANEVASPLLGRLLKMARQYRAQGQQRQAMEMLWELVEDHDGSHQASAAHDTLLEIAAEFERAGAPRMARSIYERLLDDGE